MKSIKIIIMATPIIMLLCLIIAQHQHGINYTGASDIKDGISRNQEIALVTSNRWGTRTFRIETDDNSSQLLKSLKVELQDSPKDELVSGLKSEICKLVSAYANGSYEAISAFYIATNVLIDSNAVAAKLDYFHANPAKLVRVSVPSVNFKRAQNISPALVKYNAPWIAVLHDLYKNQLEFLLLNEFAMKSYNAIPPSDTQTLSAAQLAKRIDDDVTNMCHRMDASADLADFITPWELVNSETLSASIFQSTNQNEGASRLSNSRKLSGPQMTKLIWCHYSPSPEQVLNSQGFVWRAVFEAVIKPRNVNYLGPVQVSFYYNPDEKRWRVTTFCCHAQIGSSVPF